LDARVMDEQARKIIARPGRPFNRVLANGYFISLLSEA
jgi:hypothetical protein